MEYRILISAGSLEQLANALIDIADSVGIEMMCIKAGTTPSAGISGILEDGTKWELPLKKRIYKKLKTKRDDQAS